MKTCRACGETKPLDEFHKRKASPDGLKTRCKECILTEAREYRSRPDAKARMAEYRAEYYARPEIKERRAEHYARPEIKARKAEYYAQNRSDILAYQAEYYARPEAKARVAEYRAENRHIWWEDGYRKRTKKFGFEPVIERFTRDDLIAKYGDECWHCGGPFEELDHHPLAVVHGGSHTLENCRPSCAPCNRAGANVRRTNTTTEKSN